MILSDNGRVMLSGNEDDLVFECASACASMYKKIESRSKEDAKKFVDERLPMLIAVSVAVCEHKGNTKIDAEKEGDDANDSLFSALEKFAECLGGKSDD